MIKHSAESGCFIFDNIVDLRHTIDMTLLDALILSIVEGFTEFLPVSSTGHLIIAGELLGIPADAITKSFYISIQCAAIASVAVLYFWEFFRWEMLTKLVIAFIPTGIIGLTLYPFIKSVLLGNVLIVGWALIIGGILMILLEKRYDRRGIGSGGDTTRPISYPQAFGIGLMQAIAVIPGVSRAGATILGGMSVGVDRKQIVEFSFLLAVPTMAAATLLDIMETLPTMQLSDAPIFAVGFAGSFLTALASITWLMSYIRSHTFSSFGYYRIIAGSIVLLFIA